MHGLNRLLKRPSQLGVLRVLYHAEGPLTGREIERRVGLSNRATMKALEGLVECSAVLVEQDNQAYWFTINKQHYLVSKALKPAFEAEDLFWDDLRKTVRRYVRPRPIAAVVTGPLAREDDLDQGRLDLTMLFSTGRDRIRAYRTMERLVERIHERYALQADSVLLDINTMDRDEYDSLWRRVEREGILLFGTLP
jgi:hypothetical protein